MVAVMIVSVVVSAMMALRGNSSNLLIHIKKDAKTIQYASFLPWSKENGLEPSTTNLYRLSNGVEMDDALHRQLKAISIEIRYKKEYSYDTNSTTFEIGKTTLKNKDFQISLQRITQK